MIDLFDKKRKSRLQSESGSSDGSLVLGLSLFIILLAFFIVMNGLSQFSEPKVNQVFNSLEIAFASSLLPSDVTRNRADEREGVDENGEGDALEELQGVLQSILPNLDLTVDPDPSGGSVMAIRMRKDQFERLSPMLLPLFSRILREKDIEEKYRFTLTTYVRRTDNAEAAQSHAVAMRYVDAMERGGLPRERMGVTLTRGNPAFLMITFEEPPAGSGAGGPGS